MKLQYVAGDIIIDFKMGDLELEAAVQVREVHTDNPGLSVHCVAIGLSALKVVIKLIESGEWAKQFDQVDINGETRRQD